MVTLPPGQYERSKHDGDGSQKLLRLLFHGCGLGRVELVARLHLGAYGYDPDRNWFSRYGHGREGALVHRDKHEDDVVVVAWT
ncbi:MAG: hypothetical protein WCY82_01910 [Desulfotomaculaceae bacterium]